MNSPVSSPGSNQSSPGISAVFTALAVAEDTPVRRKLAFSSDEGVDLEQTKKRIREMTSPLVAKKGDHANDVFPINFSPREKSPQAVFKPGIMNAQKAVLCCQVAQILGLGKSVPETVEARASLVISKEDLDETLKPIIYKRVVCNGQPWLANPADCYPVHTSNKKSLSFKGGYDFLLEPEDDGYNLFPKTAKSEKHHLAHEQVRFIMLDGQKHVVKYTSAHPIALDDGQDPYVLRGEQRLSLKSSQGLEPMSGSDDDELFASPTLSADETDLPDDVFLVGEDVDGLLQPWIDHLPAAVGSQQEARNAFLGRIRTCSLIDAVVLSVLFNTEDGKVSLKGDDDNFLFCEGDEGIDVTMIDFDETWPTSNELKIDGKTTSFRLGLLGFSKAHEVLTKEENDHFVSRLQAIGQHQVTLTAKLQEFQLLEREKVHSAFCERLQRIVAFDATGCSLRDFVFHVFPAYREQFLYLQKAGRSIGQIADYVGYASVEEILQSTK